MIGLRGRFVSGSDRENFPAPLEPRWMPGVTAGYHAATSWYVLGEIVRRVDGRPFEKYVREEIFLPLGMSDSHFTLSAHEYREYGERIGFIYDTSGGELVDVPAVNGQDAAEILRPGASARSDKSARPILRNALQRRRIVAQTPDRQIARLTTPRGKLRSDFQARQRLGFGVHDKNRSG